MKYSEFKYGEKKYGYGDVKFIIDRSIYDMENNTEKAYLNYTDMNRVGKNINTILEILNITNTIKTDWAEGDFPTNDIFLTWETTLDSVYSYVKDYMDNDFIWGVDLTILNYQTLNRFEEMTFKAYQSALNMEGIV